MKASKVMSAVVQLPSGLYLWVVYQGMSLVDTGREVYADAAGQRADACAWRATREAA